jgi:hypothetical protein
MLLSTAVPGAPAGEDVLLIVFNAGAQPLTFALPRTRSPGRPGRLSEHWACVLATGPAPEPADGAVIAPERSVCVLEPLAVAPGA